MVIFNSYVSHYQRVPLKVPPNGTVTVFTPLSQLSTANLHQIFGGADLRRVGGQVSSHGGSDTKPPRRILWRGPKKRCFLFVVNLIHDFWV